MTVRVQVHEGIAPGKLNTTISYLLRTTVISQVSMIALFMVLLHFNQNYVNSLPSMVLFFRGAGLSNCDIDFVGLDYSERPCSSLFEVDR
jgi:hypothetical protein